MLPISSPFVISVINLYNCNTVVNTLFYGNIAIIFQRSTCDKFNTAFNKAFYTDAVFANIETTIPIHTRRNVLRVVSNVCLKCLLFLKPCYYEYRNALCLVLRCLTSIASPPKTHSITCSIMNLLL